MIDNVSRRKLFEALRRRMGHSTDPTEDVFPIHGLPPGHGDMDQAARWLRGTEPHFEDNYEAHDWNRMPSGGVAEHRQAIQDLVAVVRGDRTADEWLADHDR